MTGKFSSYKMSSNCCASAAACSSAQIVPNLDTAILLVVSICVICLRVIITQ